MTSRNRGPAPVTPLTPSMGLPSKLPTHTATVTSLVYPTVQLSRKPFEVPVFTATGNGRSSALFSPNEARRAWGSARMSVMTRSSRGATDGASGVARRPNDGPHGEPRSAAGQRGVRIGELEQAHFAVAQRERGAVVRRVSIERSKAERPQAFEQATRAEQRRRVDRGDVVRIGQRFAETNGPVVTTVVILRVVVDPVMLPMLVDVGEHGRRREAQLLEGQLVDEGLERRPWLPLGQHAVVFPLVRGVGEARRAHVRQHFAGSVLEHDHRRRGHVLRANSLHHPLRRDLGFALQPSLERGGDLSLRRRAPPSARTPRRAAPA